MTPNKDDSTGMTSNVFASFFLGATEVVINVKSIYEVVNFPEKIIQMPLAPEFLLGVFNLRGLIIPIVNLKALLNFADRDVHSFNKVAIVEHQGAKIGLLFDATSEILRIKQEEINEFSYPNEGAHQVISGAIKLNDGSRILQVINPFGLIAIENVPQIIEQQRKYDQHRLGLMSHHQLRKKCISFTVSGVRLGFEITEIYEIIKVEGVQISALSNDLCLGMINLRGTIVPIVDMTVLLGLDKKDGVEMNNKKIIVLKRDRDLFGLLVGFVESINSFLPDDVLTIPLLNNKRSHMFLGCIANEEGNIVLLSPQAVLTNEDVARLTQGHSKLYKSQSTDMAQSKKLLNRQSYISFRLDHLFAVGIGDIREIIDYTNDIIVPPGMPAFVKGVLNLRGKLVTIIDTRKLYALKQLEQQEHAAKILIFEMDDEKFGLVVDSLESIVTVDEDKKLKVPSLMVQKIKDQMQNDIKEIISFKQGEKEAMLIVLSMAPVGQRIKKAVAA